MLPGGEAVHVVGFLVAELVVGEDYTGMQQASDGGTECEASGSSTDDEDVDGGLAGCWGC